MSKSKKYLRSKKKLKALKSTTRATPLNKSSLETVSDSSSMLLRAKSKLKKKLERRLAKSTKKREMNK